MEYYAPFPVIRLLNVTGSSMFALILLLWGYVLLILFFVGSWQFQ